MNPEEIFSGYLEINQIMQAEFKQIIEDFRNNMEDFKKKYNLDEGDIFIKINSDGPIGGMKDWHTDGKRIPNYGFLFEIEFFLAENYQSPKQDAF